MSAGGGLVRRPARAVPAGLLAVAMLGIGGLGIWLLGTYVADDAWPAGATGTMSAVGSAGLASVGVRIAAIGVAVAGAVLVLCALVPGRPRRVRVLDDDIPGQSAISRRDLARRVQRGVEDVDGVHSARAAVRRRRIDVDVATVVDDPAPVTRGATAAAQEAVDDLHPAGPSRVRVRTRRRS